MSQTTKSVIAMCFLMFAPVFCFGALPHSSGTRLHKHLREVNRNWEKVEAKNYNQFIAFDSDADRIQLHLLLVGQVLRAKSIGHLTELQKSNRFKMLNALHAYALTKKFPLNTGHSVRQPYFIDNFGTHCAVGFLVKEAGFGEISKAISLNQNFVYVKEIVSPELVKWSIDFGFTLDELAWIQPAYAPAQTYSQVGGGTNGTVTVLNTDSMNKKLLIGGQFTELNNLPCLNVGYYENNQLSCFGSGISGKVLGIGQNNAGDLFVGGEFVSNGITYPMASFDGTTWTYIGIPNVPNAQATCYNFNQGYPTLSIIAPSIISGEEIWVFSQNQWIKRASTPGKIFAINVDSPFGYTYAGKFDQIEVFENNNWTVKALKNFASYHQGAWVGSQTGIPDTIKCIYTQGNSIYLGGVSASSANEIVLARFLNGVSQPLLFNSYFDVTNKNPEIKVIKQFNNVELAIGGSFDGAIFGVGTFGQNLMSYNTLSATFNPISVLDSTVFDLTWVENKFYVGGAFKKDTFGGAQNKKHLVVLDGFVGINEDRMSKEFSISPNPSKGNLSIKGGNLEKVEILDPMGKTVHSGNKSDMDLQHLPTGVYIVRLTNQEGAVGTIKWIKE